MTNLMRLLCTAMVTTLIWSCENPAEAKKKEPQAKIGSIATTIPFAEASVKYKVGDRLLIRVNRTGAEVIEVPVALQGTLVEGSDNLYVLRGTRAGVIFGQGDSGSPVVNSKGEVIAVVCYGFDGDSTMILARAIDDAVGIGTARSLTNGLERPTSFQRLGLAPVSTADGYSSFSQNALSGDRTLQRSSTGTLAAPIPGQSIGVWLVSGDLIYSGWVGTLSLTDTKGNGWVFGHPVLDTYIEATVLPVTTVNMLTMVTGTLSGSFKLAQPTSNYIGNFIKDTYFGGLVDMKGSRSRNNVTVNISGSTKLKPLSSTTHSHLLAVTGEPDWDDYSLLDSVAYPVKFELRKQGVIAEKGLKFVFKFTQSGRAAPHSTTLTYVAVWGQGIPTAGDLIDDVASSLVDDLADSWGFRPSDLASGGELIVDVTVSPR